MSKKFLTSVVVTILLMLSLTLTFAQEEEVVEPQPAEEAVGTVALVDRGIVVPKGKGEAGFDLWINLSKDAAAKSIYLSGNGAFDRYPGISFAYGLMDKLQLGFAAPVYAYAHKDIKVNEPNAGFNLFGTYQVIDFLAAELQVQLPSFKKFGDGERVGVLIGFPFKYVVQKGLVAVHARPDFRIAFPKEEATMLIFFDVGATFNFTPELFADLSFGIGKVLKPSKIPAKDDPTKKESTPVVIPLGLFFGYTLMPALDLGLFFGFNDLKGQKADARYLGIQAAYRL